MNPRRTLSLATLASLAALLLTAPPASAAGPEWQIESQSNTTVAPDGTLTYYIHAYNTGDGDTDGSKIELLAELPEGMTAQQAELSHGAAKVGTCADASDGVSPVAGATSVVCSLTEALPATGTNYLTLRLGAEASLSASGTLTARLSVAGGGAASADTVDPTRASATPPAFGIDAFDTEVTDAAGEASTLAGAHPAADLTSFDFNTLTGTRQLTGDLWPVEPFRDAAAELPPGLLGNPTAASQCTLGELANSAVGFVPLPLCDPTSQLGTATVRVKGVNGGTGISRFKSLPLFNLQTPPGVPARFGFNVLGSVIVLDAHLRSGSDYSVTVGSEGIPEALAIVGNTIEFWGDPTDESHDSERACPGKTPPAEGSPSATDPGCETGYTRPEHQAFLRNPTSCTEAGQGLATTFRADSWDHTGAYDERTIVSHEAPGYPLSPEPSTFPAGYTGPTGWGDTVGIEECDQVPFEPSFSATPTTNAADSPTGLQVHLHMPQHGLEDPAAISESDLKTAKVILPAGISVNPAAAGGQGACTAARIGYKPGTSAPYEFSAAPQSCPDDSKIGTAELETPLLGHTLNGAVYLAQQQDNPFGSLLAMYLVVEDEQSGTTLKLPGEITADPDTGRLTTTFDENPQLPFEHLRLHLFGGARGALKTPPACGEYSTQATLTGWSGKVVEEQSAFKIEKGPGGGACPAGSFAPKLSAGTQNPVAGQTSPFNLRLSREDGEQQLAGITATLPPGLSGYLKGIPYCPDSTLAAISSEIGTGNAQIASPSCPSASQVGTVTVGAGAGPNPFYTTQGRAYLAGPYKGAPLSLAVVTPAVAGPFDLGSVLVRNALKIDPETAQITAVSDPFPTILHGIPLDLRDVRVDLSREHFTLNPTSCEPMQIGSTITSTAGATASPSQRFQVSGCDALGFKPKLSLKLRGATKRAGNPALTATLTMPAGGANIAAASVALPRSEFLDQAHIKTICTRVQFAADQCPAGSIYGKATATTPILDQPLSGNVYLRSSNHNLPDLVMKLRGPASQPIEIDAVGRIDTFHRGIRTTFETVPDAPLSKVVLEMPGGRKSLLENSTNICRSTNRATARFTGQNGKLADFRPALEAKCPKQKPHRHRDEH